MTYLARTSTHTTNITGNGDAYFLKFDQCIEADGITYNNSNGHFTLTEDGIYVATWSLPVGNLNSNNTSGAGWIHAGGYEPFIYNGNPYATNNLGSAPGGGSDIISINGAHVFKADVSEDSTVWLALRVGGHSSKNVTLLYDAFFSLQKVAEW